MSKKAQNMAKVSTKAIQRITANIHDPARKRPPNAPNVTGTGVGKGHGGNTPNLPVIRELPLDERTKAMQRQGLYQPYLRMFKMGKAFIMLAHSDPEGWHLSISRPDRYPDWDWIAAARYQLIPEGVQVGMILPPPHEFVNLHNYCFHLHELPENWREMEKQSNIAGPGYAPPLPIDLDKE